jgi:hypothetical protein
VHLTGMVKMECVQNLSCNQIGYYPLARKRTRGNFNINVGFIEVDRIDY